MSKKIMINLNIFTLNLSVFINKSMSKLKCMNQFQEIWLKDDQLKLLLLRKSNDPHTVRCKVCAKQLLVHLVLKLEFLFVMEVDISYVSQLMIHHHSISRFNQKKVALQKQRNNHQLMTIVARSMLTRNHVVFRCSCVKVFFQFYQ